jgi:putative membrane protein
MMPFSAYFPEPAFPEPKPFGRNILLKLYCIFFPLLWIFVGFTSTNFTNWLLENVPTVTIIIVLAVFHKHFAFSNTSYTLIFIFLLLHLYGSQNTYAENPFGQWLKTEFDLERNHYDRIVHFNFGFLLAYPLQEILWRLFTVRNWQAYFLPVELTLSVSAFYEIVEWLVADVFFPKLGAVFIGAQGDTWDSQKDIFLATLGAFISMIFLLFWRYSRSKNTAKR